MDGVITTDTLKYFKTKQDTVNKNTYALKSTVNSLNSRVNALSQDSSYGYTISDAPTIVTLSGVKKNTIPKVFRDERQYTTLEGSVQDLFKATQEGAEIVYNEATKESSLSALVLNNTSSSRSLDSTHYITESDYVNFAGCSTLYTLILKDGE